MPRFKKMPNNSPDSSFLKKTALCFFAALIIATPLYAKTINELKNEKETLNSDTKEVKLRLSDTQAELSGALAEIGRLDMELDAVTNELFSLNEQIALTEELIEETEVELATAEDLRESQYAAYKKRVRYLYIKGTAGYLDVILKAADISDFLNRVDYVNRIIEYDKNMVDNLAATEKLISGKLKKTQEQKRQKEYLAATQVLKKNELEMKLNEKASLVEALTLEESKYIQQINDLEEENKRIEKLIREAEAEAAKKAAEERARAAAVYNGGKIGWPVPSSGEITSPFGDRPNPISGKPEFHTGIDIAAAYGANIAAAEGGVVLSAGYSGGYGYAVVISHGGGLSTMYGHNSKLLVTAGQTVTRGQVIAYAGSTGYSTGNHLHFEVRLNGTATDPMKYLR